MQLPEPALRKFRDDLVRLGYGHETGGTVAFDDITLRDCEALAESTRLLVKELGMSDPRF